MVVVINAVLTIPDSREKPRLDKMELLIVGNGIHKTDSCSKDYF